MTSTPGFNNPAYLVGQFGTPIWGVSDMPFTGNYFWVNEASGSDGNTGGPADPFATLTQALSKCTDSNSDVIFLVGTVHVTATVNWSKSFTHLIGLTSPSNNNRARISQTGSSVFTPLVNVTGSGCIFKNIGTFHGFADASTQICWAEAGGRNYYENCQFYGMGNATAAAQAGSRSLTVAGSGENLFVGCTIGLDTVVRATNANASLEFLSASPRNVFRNCVFQSDVSAAGDTHVTIGVGGIDRYVLFDGCVFSNAEFGGPGATAMTAAISANASAGGQVIVTPTCISVGATKLSASGPVYVGQISAAGGGTTGLGVVAS